jgi:hypothetical protein
MRKLVFFVVTWAITLTATAQKSSFWTPVNEASINYNLFAKRQKPASYQLFRLNELVMRSTLAAAPSERTVTASRSSFIISVPTENGKFEDFRVVDAPVMDAALAAKYPGIKSYAGVSTTNPSVTIRFSVSKQGFNAMILATGKSTIYIDPVDAPAASEKYYIAVARKDVADYRQPFTCLTEEFKQKTSESGVSARLAADDGRLRTYRLAMTSSGEFSQFWLNGTETTDAERKAKVLAAMNVHMTRVNGIYERDFGIRMVLVPNNDAIIYLNASTDPFGTTSSNWNSQSQSTIDGVIGSANYDIGHFVHRGPTNNGNAGCIGCVCTAGSKGRGWTSYIDLGNTDFYVVDYLTHEIGHQFGGNHTFAHSFEGTIAQCEPGSGSTIMGYAGITGATTDIQLHSDDYFHSISIQQISTYIKSTAGGCAAVTVTGNTAPTVNAGLDYTIPRSTPFTLTGTASDVDGDALTYYWEQINARTSSSPTVPSATATAGPNFRSYQPVTNTSRTFPQLSSILDGTNNNKWEVLPSVARSLTFRFTAKENRVGGSNANTDDAIVTVNGTAGPFAVTAPNTSSVVWLTGSTQTVTWSVNSTNLSPVNCANVRISLSTDGGLTFPLELLASTPNDGSQTITVPAILSTTCRVKVEAVGNIFFDISNTNFTITDVPPPCTTPGGLTSSAITASAATISWAAVSGSNNYDVDYKTNASGTWISAAVATTSLSVNLSGLAASTLYDWRVRANCTGGSSTYAQAQFTTTAVSTCPGPFDVSTNGTRNGAAQIPFNTNVLGRITPSGDLDFYRFVITTGGTATVTLTTLPADYDLRIYSNNGQQLAVSQNGGTANETITRTYTPGTYFARVEGYNGANNATVCYTLRVATGTASREGAGVDITQTFKVNIFPNPASQVLNINTSGNDELKVASIFDVNGKQVINRNLTQGTTAIDISKLPGGIYFIKLNTAGGNLLYTQKFVKQ